MRILLGDAQNLPHVFAIGVWKFPTGLRTFAVNPACICLHFKERTRSGLQNPVAVCISLQVSAGKVADFHSQVLCDANDVALLENGTGCFAAVRAGEAINSVERCVVSCVKLIIQVLRGLAAPSREKALNGLAVARRPEQLPFVFVLQCGS